jgi:hypothetical protein
MFQANNKILGKMLERLFGSLLSGPALNCRPHSSRQRVDFTALGKLKDIGPEAVLGQLLGTERKAKISAKVAMPAKRVVGTDEEGVAELSAQERAARQAWVDQQGLLQKLRIIIDDARTYEQDTGVGVLSLGFPLLTLPPGALGSGKGRGFNRRIIAPVAFIPIAVTVRQGPTPTVELACRGDGVDLVIPNTALFAWLEQQTAKERKELFHDEEGEKPWMEVCGLVRRVCELVQIQCPEIYSRASGASGADAALASVLPADFVLKAAPKAEESESQQAAIMASAVLGLFPMANQGLLRDTQAMAEGEELKGPIESFLKVDVSLDTPPAATPDEPAEATKIAARKVAEQRLISRADPCQKRAVMLARNSSGLVVHGPPGTGKSQTITNIIGDHLVRGQRVLFVCDKRTALDVVANRLEHMGLGKLCGLVHDPQRDQRDLYRALREQLEGLSDASSEPKAEARLAAADSELQQLHDELMRHWSALMEGGDESFHGLMGRWLAEEQREDLKLTEGSAGLVNLSDLEKHLRDVRELMERAERSAYPKNQWVEAHGLSLKTFLARPMQEIRGALAACLDGAHSADVTIHPAIPDFHPGLKLTEQAETRAKLAERIEKILAETDVDTQKYWAAQPGRVIEDSAVRLGELEKHRVALASAPRDPELAMLMRDDPPPALALAQQIGALAAYIEVEPKWYSFVAILRKAAAKKVLRAYGLTLGAAPAQRLHAFLSATRARMLLQEARFTLLGDRPNEGTPDDEGLIRFFAHNTAIVQLLDDAITDPALQQHAEAIKASLLDAAAAASFIEGLKRSPARAKAIIQLDTQLREAKLFSENDETDWLGKVRAFLCKNGHAGPMIQRLSDTLDTLEDVLRVPEQLKALAPALRGAIQSLIDQSADADAAICVLRRAALGNAIAERLRHDPNLQMIDDQRLKSTFDRYRHLEDQKMGMVRDAILHKWVTRQRDRMLASTGSRLNSIGADLRRRLTSRGQKAMRLRQVISVGQEIEGGDPLFDLCPVWMASPETVAQIFPRKPLFDIVVFDEASQCRLEEGLPVLTRASRVVIAGDPKQLPPTRFFETAITTSEEEEANSDQELFETHQGEVEDLLQAALNLQIEQCYLDVHYRSRNADLIGFSNEHFYGSRLQPIPGHPANRTTVAPIRLYQVDGVYHERTNEVEADRVCKIVHDLLRRAEAPSIGIACFNLDQRDLIVEKLEEMALADHDFGRRLAVARTRRGHGSFEGLFVKNLENVQGDERDHIIISTTYGPDKQGKFYKRFGPLGSSGGGRRLNVLVTRARAEVHLVTSIPPAMYANLPPIPPGQTAGGGWLLFSYLSYARHLTRFYEQEAASGQEEEARRPLGVNVLPSKSPSLFCEGLAKQIARKHGMGSDVHWGNDGFCVDLALHHPNRPEDVTVGVLCDGARYRQADDPVEWDLFRTMIHESQGWKLQRLWTPHYFRDPEGCAQRILRLAEGVMASEGPKDAIAVTKGEE